MVSDCGVLALSIPQKSGKSRKRKSGQPYLCGNGNATLFTRNSPGVAHTPVGRSTSAPTVHDARPPTHKSGLQSSALVGKDRARSSAPTRHPTRARYGWWPPRPRTDFHRNRSPKLRGRLAHGSSHRSLLAPASDWEGPAPGQPRRAVESTARCGFRSLTGRRRGQ